MEGSASPAARSESASTVRLAELLAVLSLGTDLGMGQPMEHILRQCLISLRLTQAMGLDAADREVVFYAALLAWVGCHVDAYEQARWFGDDLALKADFRRVDFGSAAAGPLFMLRHLGAGVSVVERVKLGAGFAGDGRRAAASMLENHWRAPDGLAERLGLAQRVRDSIEQDLPERWDGKGPRASAVSELPGHLRGWSTWPTWSRCTTTRAAPRRPWRWPRQRSGTQFDPQVVEVFAAEAGAACSADLDSASSWDGDRGRPALGARLAGGPRRGAGRDRRLHRREVAVLIRHSRGVADLAGEAALRCGLLGPAGRRWYGGPGWCATWAVLACQRGVGQARGAEPRGDRAGAAAPVPDRADAGLLPGAGAAGRDRRAAPRAAGRVRLPAGCPAGRSAPRGGCWPPRTTSHGPSRGRTGPRCRGRGRAGLLRAEARAGRLDGDAVAAVLAAAGHQAARRQDR
jgi:hypothetical protein